MNAALNDPLSDHKNRRYGPGDQETLSALSDKVKESQFLPKYHIFPRSGLMNDPNGLAYFNGKYQVFFQWYPFAPVHGLKHWGHTTSEDLCHWSEQEVALVPEKAHEKNGCYSGNAIEHEGELYLFYTANYKTPKGKIPTQALAIMDSNGELRKLDKPILTGKMPGLSGELRDPYVFKRNGRFYMLLGGSQFTAGTRQGFGDKGVLLLYQSADLLNWDYLGTIGLPFDTGYMLECPSLIEVDGKDVLFLSPMGLQVETQRFKNRFATLWAVGTLDIDKLCFRAEAWDEMDAGFDFYAPQAFRGEGRRPLLFAWFGCGEPTYPICENTKHGLTFPQEMSITDGKLRRFPAREILAVFGKKESFCAPEVEIDTKHFHLSLTKGWDFTLGSSNDYWSFSYDPKRQIARVSREPLANKIDEEYGFERQTRITELKCIDIFVDNSFVEIYLNGGEKVFTFRVFQDNDAIVACSLAGKLAGIVYRE